MSSSLYWKPIPKKIVEYNIGQLKYVIKEKYFSGDEYRALTMKQDSIPYLQGLADGSTNADFIRDAKRLIEGIEKHGEVEVYFHS